MCSSSEFQDLSHLQRRCYRYFISYRRVCRYFADRILLKKYRPSSFRGAIILQSFRSHLGKDISGLLGSHVLCVCLMMCKDHARMMINEVGLVKSAFRVWMEFDLFFASASVDAVRWSFQKNQKLDRISSVSAHHHRPSTSCNGNYDIGADSRLSCEFVKLIFVFACRS